MKLTLYGKDPNMINRPWISEDERESFLPFLEFAEYYRIEVDIDPKTGEGTCKFVAPKKR